MFRGGAMYNDQGGRQCAKYLGRKSYKHSMRTSFAWVLFDYVHVFKLEFNFLKYMYKNQKLPIDSTTP